VLPWLISLILKKCFDRFVKDFTRIAITCEGFIAFINRLY